MRDYAKYSRRKSTNPFLKLLLVLCILLSISGLIYLGVDLVKTYSTEDHNSITQVIQKKFNTLKKVEKKPVIKKETSSPKKALPEPEPIKPKFDFYTLLPQMKMSSSIAGNPALQSTHNHSKEYFVLQIASLQSPEAAEDLMNRVNALGVLTHTQTVQENGKTWIRVVSKAYPSFQAAEAAQGKLHQHHIASLLVKTKD